MNSSLFPEVSHQAWLLDTRGVSVLSSGSSVKAFRSRISFIIMSIFKTSVILDYQDLRFENTIVKSTVFQSRLFESCRYFSTEIPEPQTHSTVSGRIKLLLEEGCTYSNMHIFSNKV